MLMCLLSVIIPMPSCLSTTHICSNTEVVRPQGIYLHVTYCTSFDPTKIMLVTYEHVLLYTARDIDVLSFSVCSHCKYVLRRVKI